MSKKITICLSEESFADLQAYANEFNFDHTVEAAAAGIILARLNKIADDRAFMLKLEKDLEEINARKSQK